MSFLKKHLPLLMLLFFLGAEAHAISTEIGVNYGRKRTTFDSDNFIDSESTTGSVSFYFLEKLALELSYTSALGVREETLKSGSTIVSRQTVVQRTEVYGSDLIWVLADRKAFFQPYVKGGAAYIKREQEVKVNSLKTYTISPSPTVVPSYGVGFKISITESMGLKVSYDAWRTPVEGGSATTDDAVRVGITWML